MLRGNGTSSPGGGGRGRGRMGGQNAAGPGGECICPVCNTTVPHLQGQPCNQAVCPKCGTHMTRK